MFVEVCESDVPRAESETWSILTSSKRPNGHLATIRVEPPTNHARTWTTGLLVEGALRQSSTGNRHHDVGVDRGELGQDGWVVCRNRLRRQFVARRYERRWSRQRRGSASKSRDIRFQGYSSRG